MGIPEGLCRPLSNNPNTTVEELKAEVTATVESIPKETMAAIMENFSRCLDARR
jgi:hypothetical protein